MMTEGKHQPRRAPTCDRNEVDVTSNKALLLAKVTKQKRLKMRKLKIEK